MAICCVGVSSWQILRAQHGNLVRNIPFLDAICSQKAILCRGFWVRLFHAGSIRGHQAVLGFLPALQQVEKGFAKRKTPKKWGEGDSLLLVMSYVRNPRLRKNGTLPHLEMCCNSWCSPANPIPAAHSIHASAAETFPECFGHHQECAAWKGCLPCAEPALCAYPKKLPVRVRNEKVHSGKEMFCLWPFGMSFPAKSMFFVRPGGWHCTLQAGCACRCLVF